MGRVGRHEGFGADSDSQPRQERPLANRTPDPCTGPGGGAAEGGEIHMCGQVRLAGCYQGIAVFMVLDRLQGIAGGAFGVAVIDEQSRPRLPGQASGDGLGQGRRRRPDLKDNAVSGHGPGPRKVRRDGAVLRWTVGEDEPKFFLVTGNSDHPLAPALMRLLELAHRQRVEEFIGDKEQRPFRDFGKIAPPLQGLGL